MPTKYPNIWLDHYERTEGVLRTLLKHTPVYWAFVSVCFSLAIIFFAIGGVLRWAM